VREKSHFCIGVYLDHCVERGDLEPKWSTMFHAMSNLRQSEQYSFGSKPDKKEVLSHIQESEAFMSRMGEMILE
jgi:uncharacterized protein (UPF0332 family)